MAHGRVIEPTVMINWAAGINWGATVGTVGPRERCRGLTLAAAKRPSNSQNREEGLRSVSSTAE